MLQLVRLMIDADMKLAEQERTFIDAGQVGIELDDS